MKNRLFVLCTMLCACIATYAVQVWDGTAAPWTKGSGTESNPYLIETPANLAYLQQILNETANSATKHFSTAYYRQTDDLDMGGKTWNGVGTITAFSGTYDGNGHSISNAVLVGYIGSKYSGSNYYYKDVSYGIFCLCKNAVFRHLVTNGNFKRNATYHNPSEYAYLSPMVAHAENCTFVDCQNMADFIINVGNDYTNGDDSNDGSHCVGGIVGYALKSQFIDIQNNGNISCLVDETCFADGASYIGGLVGNAENSSFDNVCNFGRIYAYGYVGCNQSSSGIFNGGIVGYLKQGTLYHSCNKGEISSDGKNAARETYNAPRLGGLIGFSVDKVSIERCYNTGDIKISVSKAYSGDLRMEGYIGGLVGYHYDASLILNACYSKNNITKTTTQYRTTYMAGLVGYMGGRDSIFNSYVVPVWDKEVGNVYGTLVASASTSCGFQNAHYISTIVADQIQGTAQTAEYMKSEAFVNQLNENGAYFRMDTKNENEGFPILGVFSTYQLQVGAGEGGTTQGSGNYTENAQVTISAIPSDTYKFIGWSDGSIDNPRTIIVQSDSTLTASFRRTHYAIKVSQDCNVTME